MPRPASCKARHRSHDLSSLSGLRHQARRRIARQLLDAYQLAVADGLPAFGGSAARPTIGRANTRADQNRRVALLHVVANKRNRRIESLHPAMMTAGCWKRLRIA